MTSDHDIDYIVGVVRELCKLPRETEWSEFKVNQSDPQEIGEYISALANGAALNEKSKGYLVWGIEDKTHAIIGTSFSPFAARKGNEPLESWLLRSLTPKIDFRFFELNIDGQPVVLLEIARAFRHPVRFQKEAYIRVGQVKKLLKDAPDRERELWRILDKVRYEDLLAAEHVTADEVLRRLDYPAYFDLLKLPLPANREGILEALSNDRLICACHAGGWNITNMGAILFAKHLADFPTIQRKTVRVIQYRGSGRTESLKEQAGNKGYANGFSGLIAYIGLGDRFGVVISQ